MPCYDGRDDHERLYRDNQAARVEAVLCAVVTAFGLDRVLYHIDLAECGVGKEWMKDWWQRHQENDAIRKRIREANETHVLHAMIEHPEDIEATVVASVMTCYFGNVRLVAVWDVIETSHS